MNNLEQNDPKISGWISIRLVAPAVPAILGWLLYDSAAWLVHHDSINYGLSDAGFGFISNVAEMIFALGPIVSVGAGLVFALPSILVFLRRVGSVSRALALNISAAIVFLCCLGAMGVVFAGLLAIALLLWIVAVLWVLTRESDQHVFSSGVVSMRSLVMIVGLLACNVFGQTNKPAAESFRPFRSKVEAISKEPLPAQCKNIIELNRTLMAEDYAIFTGKRDVPHFGHLARELAAQQKFDLMRVLLEGRELSPYNYYTMAELLATNLDASAFELLLTNSR